MSFRIDPRLPLTAEVRRIAKGEIEGMLRHLASAPDSPDKAMHGCRKRIKRLRALLRLVRTGDPGFVREENARYRDISASLAGPREAAALIETIDRLADSFPEHAAAEAFEAMRATLKARRKRLLHEDRALAALAEGAAASCRAGLGKIDALVLPGDPEQAADVLAEGARDVLTKARKALRDAGERGEASDFHDLRKAVKAHAMHLWLLKKLWPKPIQAQAQEVEALGERLGDLHDILVMRALLAGDGDPLAGKAETKLIDRLLKRSERRLRKTCLAEAGQLSSDSPKRAVKKLARRARDDLAEGRGPAGTHRAA
ncbi:CHAD domain-containing protein [Mesorhizobium sp. 10J20-29]